MNTIDVHVIGVGPVGRALLAALDPRCFRVVAVTDRSATHYAAHGIDVAALVAHKAAGLPLAKLRPAAAVPLSHFFKMAPKSIVVDVTDSAPSSARAALERARFVLASGRSLVFAAKNALALAPGELLSDLQSARVHLNAVLGGTGLKLKREVAALRAACTEIVLVPNATTSVICHTVERGGSFADGLAHARALGFTEGEPTLDLDGSDALQKLRIAACAVFGRMPTIVEPLLEAASATLDPALLCARFQRGRVTRLVGRATHERATLAYEELPVGSALATPPGAVCYSYACRDGRRRVHVGTALGAIDTARAVIADLESIAAIEWAVCT